MESINKEIGKKKLEKIYNFNNIWSCSGRYTKPYINIEEIDCKKVGFGHGENTIHQN